MPANTVRVARPSRWGNPFTIEAWGRARAIALYRHMLSGGWSRDWVSDMSEDQAALVHDTMEKWRMDRGANPADLARHELRGFNLACWCKPGTPCHADVLLEVANSDVLHP